MSLSEVWERAFQSFELFVGVGVIWLGLIEPRFPSRQVSVVAMIVVAVTVAVAWFVLGIRRARRQRAAILSQMEAAATQYEDEVG